MIDDASDAGPDVPLHRRSIVYEAFEEGDDLRVRGRLEDVRPWADGERSVSLVHDMSLSVTVRVEDMTITRATAEMRVFPHAECPAILEAFEGLVGLGVARGYTRAVQERFGGPQGCSHLEHLARSLGPVVVQAVTSRRARALGRGETPDLLSGAATPWARDTCHVWAEGGVAEQKLAAGWRPGIGPYPAQPVEVIRDRGTAEGVRVRTRHRGGRGWAWMIGAVRVHLHSVHEHRDRDHHTVRHRAARAPTRSGRRGRGDRRERARQGARRRTGPHALHVRQRPARDAVALLSDLRGAVAAPRAHRRYQPPDRGTGDSGLAPRNRTVVPTGPPRSPTTGGRSISGRRIVSRGRRPVRL